MREPPTPDGTTLSRVMSKSLSRLVVRRVEGGYGERQWTIIPDDET